MYRLALGLILAWVGPASGRSVGYLYIEANEGSSSGGHVAIRFEDHVYHFQHQAGLVRLQRDSWRRFEHLYRTLENRSIHVSEIATADATYETLRRGFERRLLVEQRERNIVEDLDREIQWLEAVVAGHGSGRSSDVYVRGAGFFEAVAGGHGTVDTQTLGTLGRKVAARNGSNFVSLRRREIRRRLEHLEPSAPPFVEVGPTNYPVTGPLFAQSAAERHEADAALDILENPHRLRSDRLVHESVRRELHDDERNKLKAMADNLTSSLSRLVASRRPDWGYPFLLGAARLVTLRRSIESGRLVLLDAIPITATRLPLTPLRRRTLVGLLAEAEHDLTTALRRVVGVADEGFVERTWSKLETAASRVAELHRARAGASELRVRRGTLLPKGEARVPIRATPPTERAQLVQGLRRARERKRDYAAQLRDRYRYHLLQRNCVSEIFRTIDIALGDFDRPSGTTHAASEPHLGGTIAPTAALNFIPFVSAQRVRSEYAVTSTTEVPSYRHHHLARMLATEPRLRVALRESNVWSSTLYEPSDGAGFFVFFTDRTVLLRPALGAINLAAGGAMSAFGLVAAPLDGGRSLRAGLSGTLFSLPEVFFVNLRKGSNEYIPPEMRPPPSP